MYFTKDRVIYNKGEHLTFFPKSVKEIYGYTFLETTSFRSRYAINEVPVYMLRDEKIEQMLTARRLKEEFLLESSFEKTTFDQLSNFFHYFYYKKLRTLYEKVRVFRTDDHCILEELDEDYPFWMTSSPFGYYVKSKKLLPKFENEWKFQKVQIEFNEVPVICEKAVGEMDYENPGTILASKDAQMLQMKKY